jgi:hemoglobin
MQDNPTVYDMVGGEITFFRLVDVFYNKLAQDKELREMFPSDLSEGKYWQFLFLMQYWGGPTRYAEQRGHPRLRMRHMPFSITPEAKEKWVRYMLEAIDEVGIQEPARGIMRAYFEQGATFMVNRYTSTEDDK